MVIDQVAFQRTSINQPNSRDISLLTRYKTMVLPICTSAYVIEMLERIFGPDRIHRN
jgi:hypothetical protein